MSDKDNIMEPYRKLRNSTCPADPMCSYHGIISTPFGDYNIDDIDAYIGEVNMDMLIILNQALKNVK